MEPLLDGEPLLAILSGPCAAGADVGLAVTSAVRASHDARRSEGYEELMRLVRVREILHRFVESFRDVEIVFHRSFPYRFLYLYTRLFAIKAEKSCRNFFR
jgi:hypothetical protein